MTILDYLDERIEACAAFTDRELASSSGTSTTYVLTANPFTAGIQLIRAKLQRTRFSDELVDDGSNNMVTFKLFKVPLGDQLVNAVIQLAADSPTQYKITFTVLCVVTTDEYGREIFT